MRTLFARLRATGDPARHGLNALRNAWRRYRPATAAERHRLPAELMAARAALAEERGENVLAGSEQAHLTRELATLRAAHERSLAREAELTDRLRHAGWRLARIDATLASLVGRLPRKWDRRLEAAQHELFQVRLALDPGITPQDGLPGDAAVIAAARPVANGRHAPHPVQADIPALPGTTWRVEVVICVHNALADVRRCLESLLRHTPWCARLILVDDSSDADCRDYLATFARTHDACLLIRNDERRGYTRAANQGLRATSGELVVLLNSDTVVTPRWLRRLVACAAGDAAIGIVGPLSNAATYQSAPQRVDADGGWAANPLPPGWEAADVAAALAGVSRRVFPRVPFLNGFCLGITRAVIETIGYFDEDAFPDGYGEENDYCLRAAAAGFALAVADDVYVFHARSQSYAPARRQLLAERGRRALIARYGSHQITAHEATIRQLPALTETRRALAARLAAGAPPPRPPFDGLAVLFLLPVRCGGGGGHSVVQEAHAMRRRGVTAQVAVRAQHLAAYGDAYPALADDAGLFFPYAAQEDLLRHAAGFDVVVGTIHTSLSIVAQIVSRFPWLMPAYYVQDYEPWFYEAGCDAWRTAVASYTEAPQALLFAKTHWLCDTVAAQHGVVVHKVSPSLDHALYFPLPHQSRNHPLRIAAMIRPRTPRRGAARTLRVLRSLAGELGSRLDVHVFGCADAELDSMGVTTGHRFHNQGLLIREQVAAVLQRADVFLDLSDYQAFGRTALEAMACGCAVVVPALGGTDEYAVHRQNALVVDTADEAACFAAARELILNQALRHRLREAAIVTSEAYTVERAAASELALFAQGWSGEVGTWSAFRQSSRFRPMARDAIAATNGVHVTAGDALAPRGR